jgi:hypothetical protein
MQKRYPKTAINQYLIVILMLLGVAALGFISHYGMNRIPFEDHFVIPWAAGQNWLLKSVNPYDQSVAQTAQIAIEESSYLAVLPSNANFDLSLMNLLLYLPFSLLPYEISRIIWVTILSLCTIFGVFIALKLTNSKKTFSSRLLLIFITVAWLPGFVAILTGKIFPLTFLLMLTSVLAITNNQDTLAGFLLALVFSTFLSSTIIVILLIIWAISSHRWTFIAAYIAGLGFLFIITYLMLPSWPRDWLVVLFNNYSNFDWIKTPLMSFAGLLPGIENFLSIFFHGIFGSYVLIQWITIVKKSDRVFIWKIFTVFVLTYLLDIQASLDHLLLIIPAVYFFYRFLSERWQFTGSLMSWILALGLSVGSWVLVPAGLDLSKPVISLGIMIGAPLIVLIWMIWIRPWASRIPLGEINP